MIVLVTGMMRTGTSLVAKQLHLMGVPMGTTMRFPQAKANGQDDWEDIEFTDMMLNRLMGIDDSDREDFGLRVKQYELSRDGVPVWGVKSPFALPYVTALREAFEDVVKVVMTTRDIEQVYRSLDQQQLGLREIQYQLHSFIDKVSPDLVIDIEESWHSPSTVEQKLQELIWA